MFDPSAPHIIILLVVVLLLFGSTRLPGAAQALGKSMHIFKRSVKGLDEDKDKKDDGSVAQGTVVPPPPQQLTSAPADQSHQAQIDAIQRQLSDLQRQSTDSQQSNSSAGAGQTDTRSY